MNKQHKWAKEITHWASGGEVEFFIDGKWADCGEEFDLNLFQCGYEFRIKPKKKIASVALFYSPQNNTITPAIYGKQWPEETRLTSWVEIPYEYPRG